MMERSLLYRLHGHQIKKDVEADPTKFREVYRSKYGRVRIFEILGVSQESKAWVLENRKCDAPGSWFCPGQYPPGLSNVLARKKDFAQLEDFNRGQADEEYQKQYFEALSNPDKAAQRARQLQNEDQGQRAAQEQSNGAAAAAAAQNRKKAVDEIYNTWEDTEDTTLMWKLISSNQIEELKMWLEEDPTVAFIRSRDGRGPMWYVSRVPVLTKLFCLSLTSYIVSRN